MRHGNMGSLFRVLVFVLQYSFILGENLCYSSVCGNSILDIHYPFKFTYEAQTKSCIYFNLSCNKTQATVIMNFPNSGDFYVQNIDYSRRKIQLFDPENCLIRKLMNLSLLFSPLQANYYENYTFSVCPRGSRFLDSSVYPIECLSNSKTFTAATRKYSQQFMKAYGCRAIGSWLIPVSWRGQFEADAPYDPFLILTWNNTVCKNCEQIENLVSGKPKAKPIARIVAIALSLPVLIIMGLTCFSLFCLHVLRIFTRSHMEYAAGAGPPMATATPISTVALARSLPSTVNNSGLDESKIIACTEIYQLPNEDDETIENGDPKTCSICLENYASVDKLRLIIKCGHFFHASCIQQWLGKNSTCPVCRTSLCHVDL